MLIHTEVAGHFDAPIEQGWQFLRDIHVLPIWHVSVVQARDIAGTFDQVGSTATVVLKLPDGLHDFNIRVTEVEPYRLMQHAGQQVDGASRYTTTVHCAPGGRGTDWTWEQDYEVPDGSSGPFGSEAFMGRLMEQVLRQSAENTKLLLEAMVAQPV